MKKLIFSFVMLLTLTSCGFKPRGNMPLAPPLYTMYLETPDPYGQLSRNLKQFLKMSGVTLVDDPQNANSTLTIVSDQEYNQLVGINGTQQTRQYNLILTVVFQIVNNQDNIALPAQTITESRALTITNDQVLASSNEALNLYTQMHQSIVYDIMSRLSSEDMTTAIMTKPKKEPLVIEKKPKHHKLISSES